jgi:hypothetical protein
LAGKIIARLALCYIRHRWTDRVRCIGEELVPVFYKFTEWIVANSADVAWRTDKKPRGGSPLRLAIGARGESGLPLSSGGMRITDPAYVKMDFRRLPELSISSWPSSGSATIHMTRVR